MKGKQEEIYKTILALCNENLRKFREIPSTAHIYKRTFTTVTYNIMINHVWLLELPECSQCVKNG